MNKKKNLTSKSDLKFIEEIHDIIIDYLDKKNNKLVRSLKTIDNLKSNVDFTINDPNSHSSIKIFNKSLSRISSKHSQSTFLQPTIFRLLCYGIYW